jgi:hypothetical protein
MLDAAKANTSQRKYADKEFTHDIIPTLDLVRSSTEKTIVSFENGVKKAEARLEAQVAVLAMLADADGPIETPDYEAVTYLLTQGRSYRDELERIRQHWKRRCQYVERENKRKMPVHMITEHGATRTKWVKDPFPSSKLFWAIPEFRDVEYIIPWVRLLERAEFPEFKDVVSEIRNGLRDGDLAVGGTIASELRSISLDLWQIVRTSHLSDEIDGALALFLARVTELQSPIGFWSTVISSKSGVRRTEKPDVLITAALSFAMLITEHYTDHAQRAVKWLLTQQRNYNWSDIFGWNVLATCLASLSVYLSGLDSAGCSLDDACRWLLLAQSKTGEWKDEDGISPSISTVLALDVLNLIHYRKTPSFQIKTHESGQVPRYMLDIMGSIDKSNQLMSSAVGFKLYKDIDASLAVGLSAELQHPCQKQQDFIPFITDLNKLLIEGVNKGDIGEKYHTQFQSTLDAILHLMRVEFAATQDSCKKISRAYGVLRDIRRWTEHRIDAKARQDIQEALNQIGAEYPIAADSASQWSSLWERVLECAKNDFVFTIREVMEASKDPTHIGR